LATLAVVCALMSGCAGAASRAPSSPASTTPASTDVASTRTTTSVSSPPLSVPERPLRVQFGARRGFNEAEALTVSGPTLWVARWQDPGGGNGVLLFPLNASTLALAGAPILFRTAALGDVALATAPGGAVYVRAGRRIGRIDGRRVLWIPARAVPEPVVARLLGTPAFGFAWVRRGMSLVAIDPATGARRSWPIDATIDGAAVTPSAGSVALADGLLWVSESTDAKRVYLEPFTRQGRRVRRPIAVGRGVPTAIVADWDRLWVIDNTEGPHGTLAGGSHHRSGDRAHHTAGRLSADVRRRRAHLHVAGRGATRR
jgi:hypothetical protein